MGWLWGCCDKKQSFSELYFSGILIYFVIPDIKPIKPGKWSPPFEQINRNHNHIPQTKKHHDKFGFMH